MRRLKTSLINCLILLVSVLIGFEALSAIAILTKTIPANVPSYLAPTFKPFWTVENPHFGVWHAPNAEHVHVTACYSLRYQSNSYGARDQERPLISEESRVLVLGDSFIEGFGLERKARLTELLEDQIRIPHLNFGTSGGFGPAQYLQLYRHLAKPFSHDEVLVGLLPDNDFLDNDLEHARANNDPGYKPVFVQDQDRYRLEIMNKDALGTPERDNRRAFRRGLRNIARNLTFSANAIDYLKAMSKVWSSTGPLAYANNREYSGYYDATAEQVRRVTFVLNELVDEAAPRPVRIVLIPRLSDIATYQQRGPSSLAEIFSEITSVVDLLPVFADHPNPEKLYNACDGHWSAAGAALAAESLR